MQSLNFKTLLFQQRKIWVRQKALRWWQERVGGKQKETEGGENSNFQDIQEQLCLKHHSLLLLVQLFSCTVRLRLVNLENLLLFLLLSLPNRPLSSFLSPLSTSHFLKHAGIYTQAPMLLSFMQAFKGPIAAWHFVSQFSAYYSQRDLLSYGTQWARERESQDSEWIS